MAKRRRKTAVNAENLTSDDSSDRETVEGVDEGLPDLDIAPALALIVETVDPGDVGAFVVAAEEEEVLGVLELVAHQKQNSLKGLLSAINVVAEEQVVGVWREAAHLEHANQVGVLAVDIADNLDGRIQFQERRLGKEQLPSAVANSYNFGILEADTLGDLPSVGGIQQSLNEVIQINVLDVAHGNTRGQLLILRVLLGRVVNRVDGVLALHEDGLAGLLVGVGSATTRGRLVGNVVDFSTFLGCADVVAARGRTVNRRRGRLGFTGWGR